MDMKVYSYKNIIRFDKTGIEFKDGYIINLDECRINWASSREISYLDSTCVAERCLSGKKTYFLFYTNERVKILFVKSIFPWSNKNKKKFYDIQIGLNRYGYSSFDCT